MMKTTSPCTSYCPVSVILSLLLPCFLQSLFLLSFVTSNMTSHIKQECVLQWNIHIFKILFTVLDINLLQIQIWCYKNYLATDFTLNNSENKFPFTLLSIVAYRPVAKQWLCKHRSLLNNFRNIHARNNRRTAFSMWSSPRLLLCNEEVNTPLQQ
jgi:hypothetical protein